MAFTSKRSRPLLPLALGLAALTAASPAGAQERLHLDSIPDLPLYALGLGGKGKDGATIIDADAQGGVEGSLYRGAAPTQGRPFAVTEGFGFGIRHRTADLFQIRSDASIPLPAAIGGSPGPMRIWDMEGAHRLRAQLGLGGLDGDNLAKGRGGADVEVEGSLVQGGKYGMSSVRMDVGPYPFFDAKGKATVAPRFAMEREMALTLPVIAEMRHVEVERPTGIYSFTSERVSSGFGLKPYDPSFAHGWIELIGGAWEVVHFTPPAGAPKPKLGGVERLDLQLLHADAVAFSPEREVEIAITTNFGGNWLHDPVSKAAVSTFTGTWGGVVRGYPDRDKANATEIAFGDVFTYDATFMADGSAFTRRVRVDAFLDLSFLKRRVGGSVRGAMEELIDFGKGDDNHPTRGTVSAEWWLSPIRPLELGVDLTSSQLCVAPETQATWCHRFGIFLRASARGHKTVSATAPAAQAVKMIPE